MKKILIPIAFISLLLTGCKKESIPFPEPPVIEDDRLIIHTEVQRAYLADKVDRANIYARGVEELSRPLNNTFSWEGEDKAYTVYLSEYEDYADSLIYKVDKANVSFTNLKINTTYYYKVVSDDTSIKEDSFTTSDEIIRNIYVSGVTNVRDLGGYTTQDGVLNQGVIFRTGRLNQNSVETVNRTINDKGIDTMLNVMKVKSEIDLRGVSNNEVGGLTEGVGVLGESVHYYQCPMNFDLSFDDEFNNIGLRRVFSLLGDKNNYPTFFHCSIGTDRTGYIAWLINACLGVEEEYLWRDYLFSNFGNIGSARKQSNIQNRYVKAINETSGDTLKEKATNYLLNKGVKQEEINVLREMMLKQNVETK